MAYEKNTWQSGDVVTSAKLNNIENGIVGAEPLYVWWTMGDDGFELNATYAQIMAATQAGKSPVSPYGFVVDAGHDAEAYYVVFKAVTINCDLVFASQTEDGTLVAPYNDWSYANAVSILIEQDDNSFSLTDDIDAFQILSNLQNTDGIGIAKVFVTLQEEVYSVTVDMILSPDWVDETPVFKGQATHVYTENNQWIMALITIAIDQTNNVTGSITKFDLTEHGGGNISI